METGSRPLTTNLVAYVNWALGEPHNGILEPCAVTSGPSQWRWADVLCTRRLSTVCEIDM
ncbi:hypothetical protein DPMN_148623 [Dreissena polymorpha]|uniref:C-type lectin domain-containing protein n=1 Tax=Dreissena polymorpha TaxID=45954 RepID=A0A9D4J464_DREPO|nr:hypothetical protein DPMN_148623 [Dreissena polymorpha]